MKLSLGFSPCPNDTFIFDALVNHKIDTGDLSFDVILEDVQTLNRLALDQTLHITKLSYGILPLVLDHYALLNSGSALGSGVGPLLITNENLQGKSKEWINKYVSTKTIAIPGENTTAHLLFSLAYPDATTKIFLRYDEIESFVAAGNGLGVIIHENRFTYQEKGLQKITDLGDYWETQTGKAIPLGGIVIKREIPNSIAQKTDHLIRKSIDYAFKNYPVLSEFVKMHAQEMSEAVMRKHIDLYVNHFSLDLKEEGRAAVKQLLSVYERMNNCIVNQNHILIGAQ